MRCSSYLVAALLTCGCFENRTPYGPDAGPAAPTLECFPNLDGVIERSEMPNQLDNPVEYLLATNASIDFSGGAIELRAELPGENKVSIEARSLSGTWFEDDFPADSIRVPLGAAFDSFAVLRSTESAVSLLGIASEAEDHTLLQYASPVDLYRFPLEVGDSWRSTSPVTGILAAVPYNGTDTYEVAVESIDSVALPHLRFTTAHRVRTTITSDSGAAGVVVARQQVSLISECFGEIARAVSVDNETSNNFTTAAELWRFSL